MTTLQVCSTADERLECLLSPGAFPKELPYCFTFEGVAKVGRPMATKWSGAKIPWGQFERFSIPRPGLKRRVLALPNPVHQVLLAAKIADEWKTIATHLEKSKAVSTFLPDIVKGETRSVIEFDFEQFSDRHTNIVARFGRAVAADIQRFYGSIYTHSLGWALHSKAVAKAATKNKGGAPLLGDLLDKLVRDGQDGQTIGIPTGPDTSRILAEIVAVAVDECLEGAVQYLDQKYARNVDDLIFGFDYSSSVESVVAILSQNLDRFELELNAAKTSEVSAGTPTKRRWAVQLGQIDEALFDAADQATSIRNFFEGMFELAIDYPYDNVIRFGLKKAALVEIDQANWPLFEKYLIRACRANMSVIDIVALLIIEAKTKNLNVDYAGITAFLDEVIRLGIRRAEEFEVLWAMLLCRELSLDLTDDAWQIISGTRSSPTALIALHIAQTKKPAKLDTGLWTELAYDEGLYSKSWLLAYEARVRGWLPPPAGKSLGVVDIGFADLAAKNVRFYVETPNSILLGNETKKLLQKLLHVETYPI